MQASRRIQSLYRPDDRPRIVAVSADCYQGLRDQCSEAGIEAFVTKVLPAGCFRCISQDLHSAWFLEVDASVGIWDGIAHAAVLGVGNSRNQRLALRFGAAAGGLLPLQLSLVLTTVSNVTSFQKACDFNGFSWQQLMPNCE